MLFMVYMMPRISVVSSGVGESVYLLRQEKKIVIFGPCLMEDQANPLPVSPTSISALV